jgi:hypothetical protein
MLRKPLVISSIVVSVLILAAGSSSHAKQEAPPPSRILKTLPADAVSILELEAIEPEILKAEDDLRVLESPVPLRFAEPAEVRIKTAGHGTWEQLADGSRLWRLRVFAPGASDLNFGFTRYRLPPGATLHIASLDHDYYQGPYTWEDNEIHGEFWSPVVPGEWAVIELFVPAYPAFDPELELGRVGRGFRDLFQLRVTSLKRGACNINVICPEGDPWRDQIRSVARITISGSFLCTGQLINNTSENGTPYFLTAQHCIEESSAAPSVVAYWNYESPGCGDPAGGSLGQNQSGSTWIASHPLSGGTDFTLVELDDQPSPSWNVYYSGWDARDLTPSSTTTIHHPSGDEKSISFDSDPPTATSYGSNTPSASGTHWRIGDWNIGTTEGGSSGCCLFDDATNRCIGTLSGGLAPCGNDEPDWYGRFSRQWTGGGTSGTRLSDWLDPGSTGAFFLDGKNAGGGGVSCTNVVLEPGFEGGSGSAWSESSSNGFPLITTTLPRSGSYSAWLGGLDNEVSQLWQSPPIDAAATSATLSYWYWINSGDACGYDTGELRINGVPASGHEYDLCATTDTGDYVPSATVNLLSHAGTSPEIRFYVETDSSLVSSLFIDDVVLEVCVPVAGPDLIFSDGFESGTTSAWSNTVP